MHLDRYIISASESSLTFRFESEGPRGRILKVIQFTQIDPAGVYNLAFGDVDPSTGQLSDTVVSNNGDSEKVLATVVRAVYRFCQRHPGIWVYATGSTLARTRFYQMSLNRFHSEVVELFELYGQQYDEWEEFEKNVTYVAFAARLKSLIP